MSCAQRQGRSPACVPAAHEAPPTQSALLERSREPDRSSTITSFAHAMARCGPLKCPGCRHRVRHAVSSLIEEIYKASKGMPLGGSWSPSKPEHERCVRRRHKPVYTRFSSPVVRPDGLAAPLKPFQGPCRLIRSRPAFRCCKVLLAATSSQCLWPQQVDRCGRRSSEGREIPSGPWLAQKITQRSKCITLYYLDLD